MDADQLIVKINGMKYDGWLSVRISRGLTRAAADFDLTVTERWPDIATPWQIQPFDACAIEIGGDRVLTGYVDTYEPSIEAASHLVRIRGRSKTCDLVDSMPAIGLGQYNGYTLAAIAKGIAAAWDVGVQVQTDVGAPFPAVTYQVGETAFAFLEELSRLRSVVMTDDENGDLVLTRAGNGAQIAALVEGLNILSATVTFSGARRFSQYTVCSQLPLSVNGQEVNESVFGTASDPAVPRYRNCVIAAEGALDNGKASQRAQWEAQIAWARSIEARVIVEGWRTKAKLWQVNQLVLLKSQSLHANLPLLITGLTFSDDGQGGRRTELTLGRPEAFASDPSILPNGAQAWNVKPITAAPSPPSPET